MQPQATTPAAIAGHERVVARRRGDRGRGAAVSSRAVTIPDRIGRYRILEVLGQGAMGIVYRGVDETLDRQVAIKVMSGSHGADMDARARFKREAQAAARLQHPNIVTIYELGEHEGSPFIALELLEGIDLQGAIETGLRPGPKATLPVVLQILRGLGHAHEQGIVHRDVKPSNVFLPRGRPAKIMDFGVARLAGGMTTTGIVVGTPSYMSPEQVRAGPIDGRSDLFSVGLILHELVTGEKAYRADSVVALLYKIAHEEPDLSLVPTAPEWRRLAEVLNRALARDPDDRYPDAMAMASELSKALRDLGGSADWATDSELGLMARALSQPKSVALGTDAPPLAPAVVLGTLSLREPETAFNRPATVPGRRARGALAGGLGVALVVVLLALLTRGLARAPASGGLETATPPPSTQPVSPAPSPLQPSRAPAPPPSALSAARSPATPGTAAASPPPASVDRANAELEQRHYAQALKEAQAVLRHDPGSAEAQTIAEEAQAALQIEEAIRKANAALSKGDKDVAVSEIRRGLAVNNNDARLLELLRRATE